MSDLSGSAGDHLGRAHVHAGAASGARLQHEQIHQRVFGYIHRAMTVCARMGTSMDRQRDPGKCCLAACFADSKQTSARSIKTGEVQSSAPESDKAVNIFTGNPGFYQAEGDTLNFYSFTPVPIDSIGHRHSVIEQPGKPYGFVGKPMKVETQDWTFFLAVIGWVIFASLKFGFS